jgi:nicotinamidase/pyrazinamidase
VFSNPLSNKVFGILEPYITFVYGVTTNICVNYAVLGLIERGFTTVVVMDAVKELPNSNKEVIFDIWRNQGVILETTENVVKKLPKLLI